MTKTRTLELELLSILEEDHQPLPIRVSRIQRRLREIIEAKELPAKLDAPLLEIIRGCYADWHQSGRKKQEPRLSVVVLRDEYLDIQALRCLPNKEQSRYIRQSLIRLANRGLLRPSIDRFDSGKDTRLWEPVEPTE